MNIINFINDIFTIIVIIPEFIIIINVKTFSSVYLCNLYCKIYIIKLVYNNKPCVSIIKNLYYLKKLEEFTRNKYKKITISNKFIKELKQILK